MFESALNRSFILCILSQYQGRTLQEGRQVFQEVFFFFLFFLGGGGTGGERTLMNYTLIYLFYLTSV